MAVVVSVYGKTDMAAIDRAQLQLNGLKAKVTEQQGPWSRFGSVVSSTGAKIASGLAAAGIVKWLAGSVSAAKEAEAATTSLNRAVTATGTPWITYSGHMQEVISKQSQLSAYSQGALKSALTQLTLVTGSSAKGLNLLGLATDLARAKHMDLAKAATLVGKVADGNTSALSRYGIVVDKGTTATQALAMMQGRFAGQAAAYGNTAAGAQDKFTNALHHLQVVIGTAILPLVTAFTSRITGLLEKFQELPGPVQKVIIGVAAFAGAAAILAPWISGIIGAVQAMKLAALAQKAWAAAQWLLNAAMDANPIGLIVIAIAALVATFVVLWNKCGWFRDFWIGLWDQVKGVAAAVVPVLKAVWDAISGALKAFWDWAGPFITTAVQLWWSGIKANAEAIWTIVKWLWDTVSAGVKAFWDWAGPFITTAVHVWWTSIKTEVDLIEKVVKTAWDAISKAVEVAVAAVIAAIHTIEAIVGFLQDVWDRVKSGASSAINAVVTFFSNVGSRIKGAIGDVGSMLYNVGQQIVQGLVNGIVSAWHWVTDKLSSLISGLGSAAKKLLGISSPSKVFMEIGHFTGQGLAAGLDASRGAVSAAAARMVGAAGGGPAFGASPAFAGAAGAGGSRSLVIAAGAVVVHVGAGVAGTPQELTAAVRAGVDPALLQLARAVNAL